MDRRKLTLPNKPQDRGAASKPETDTLRRVRALERLSVGVVPADDAAGGDLLRELQRPRAFPELGELHAYKKAAFLTKWAAPDRGGAIWREIEIPSANGHGTAAATARLYGLYAHGGRLPGIDLLSPDGFEALTRSRTSGSDLVLPFDIDFAAGVMRNTQLVYGPNPASFGHSGWGGSMAFGDPGQGLSAAYVMNRQSNILQGDPRGRALIDALYACL